MERDRSEQVGALAAALAKAQSEIKSAIKDSTNTAFGTGAKATKYADLASVWEACRAPLNTNGLSIVQTTGFEGQDVWLNTMLMHSSGEFISGRYPLRPTKNDPQGFGSALTYAKRYCIAAMIGVVADDDDDGNAASGKDAAAHTNGNGNGHTDAALPPLQRPKANGDTGAAAKQWAKDAEETVKHFIRIEDLRAWDEANTKAMTKLHGVDAAAHIRLNNIIAERFRSLNPLNAG